MVKNLKTFFLTEDGSAKAVDREDFSAYPGKAVNYVGESICGNWVTSLSIIQLVGISGKEVDWEIPLEGRDLLELSNPEMFDMRGNISFVPQI